VSNPATDKRTFTSLNVQTVCGAYPASYSFGEGKPVRGEILPSPPSIVEVKNQWRYTFTPPICLHSVDGVALTFYTTYNTLIITIYMRLKALTQLKIKQMTNVHYLSRVVLYNVTFDWLLHLILVWTHRISLSATMDTLNKGFSIFFHLLQTNDK